MRLLYIDDDRINTFLFEETCRLSPGLEVRCAHSGAEGIEQAGEFRPDVLVIDLHLPDTDGYALLAALRTLDGMADRPAYLCSAETADAIRDPAALAGFTGIWEKPVSLPQMLADLAHLQRDH